MVANHFIRTPASPCVGKECICRPWRASASAMGLFPRRSCAHRSKHGCLHAQSRRCWWHICGLRLLSVVDGPGPDCGLHGRLAAHEVIELSLWPAGLALDGRLVIYGHLPLCESGLRPAISMAGCTAAEPCCEPQMCLSPLTDRHQPKKRLWLFYKAVVCVAYPAPSAACPPSLPDSKPGS